VIWDYAPLRGNMGHCPADGGDENYRITASGPAGTAQAEQHIYVDVKQPR